MRVFRKEIRRGSRSFYCSPKCIRENGQGGIRTHDTLAGIPVFETDAFSHSDTCPWWRKDKPER